MNDTDKPACRHLRECGGRTYYCTVELALQIIGGKWKPIILWHLRGADKMRFGEIRRVMPNVTQKMLTQQLRELEADGLVERQVHAQVPPKVEYGLTWLGQSVLPVLSDLAEWGRMFEEQSGKDDQAQAALA